MRYHFLPTYYTNDLEEKRLASFLFNYLSKFSVTYDSNLEDLLSQFVTLPKLKTQIKKEKILEFIVKNCRRPSPLTKDLEEKRLGEALSRYKKPTDTSYDADFVKKLHELSPLNVKDQEKILIQEEIRNFCKIHGHKPKNSSKDLNEARLADRLNDYQCKGSRVYDAKFKEEMNKYPTWARHNKLPVGIYIRGNRFRAVLIIGRKTIHIGTFNTIEEAQAAIEKAKKENI